MHKRGNVLVVVLVVLAGIGFIVLLIFTYLQADKESKKIYQEMLDEVRGQNEDLKYGVGATPDKDLVGELGSDKNPRAPVIYVYPVLDRKRK